MYWRKKPEDITFQVTVGQLSFSSCLAKGDIRVTVHVGDMSKITCSGKLSEDGLTVTWDHPFLFFAPPSTAVRVTTCILPEVFTSEWEKLPLGDQMVTDVVSLLESGSAWKCNIPGLPSSSTTLSMTCKANDELILPDEHDCLSDLQGYSFKLFNFGQWSKNMPSMITKTEVELARLDLCPLGHVNHTGILQDLGIAFSLCYNKDGNVVDLNRAIEVEQRRLDLCPFGHPEHVSALAELLVDLENHYYIQKNKEDLDKLIVMQQTLLDFSPSGHSYHPRAIGGLALSLQNRYAAQGDIADLNRAIEMLEKRLELCPAGHQDHNAALNNLSVSISQRYISLGNLVDLDRTIELDGQYLELCPLGHQFHGLALQNLAVALRDHYDRMQIQSDLMRAIELFKEALETYPVYHREFPFTASQLAQAKLLLSNSSQTQKISLVDEAFEAYKLLKKCGPAASLCLLEATQDWVKDAEAYNHPSVLEAYQISLNSLDHFTSLNSSLDSRHETIQGKALADLVNDAFSCATRHDDLEMAVEVLEQGRGILWNQLARFEISIAALENQSDGGHELGRKFTRLNTSLRKHAQRSGDQGDSDPYWWVQEEWQRVVDKIRTLDGFSRFLLPPRFDDLQHTAEYGPVIIVNASKYTCDALIVLHTRAPVHVPLHCSFNDVDQLCVQLSELTQDAHAYGTHRELYVKEILRDLWSSVVEPIAAVLEKKVQLPEGSRIWWCPTSKFTLLPLHAAGPHRTGQKNLMDIYVSSYAPSLSALIRARDRLRSQNRDGAQNVISFAAVGQAHPSADTGLGQLPEVDHEIQRIRDKTDMPAEVEFEAVTGAAASIEGAVQAFRDHRWVHVACHGAQHATRPFDSWFAMGDGKLTLMRIIQERYTNSEFAFLSACHTAKGDASTPDEVLHLAAGMQFAGFNGVIGTLWRVDDAVAHEVVTRFYKEMFKHPDLDFEHAATALNTAVIETADEVSLEKRIVFVHIGI